MQTIQQNLKDIIAATKGKFFRITWKKKNGELRMGTFQTNVKKGLKGIGRAWKDADNQITVYEPATKKRVVITTDQVLSFKCGSVEHKHVVNVYNSSIELDYAHDGSLTVECSIRATASLECVLQHLDDADVDVIGNVINLSFDLDDINHYCIIELCHTVTDLDAMQQHKAALNDFFVSVIEHHYLKEVLQNALG